RDMRRTPSAVCIGDTKEELLAVDEANSLGIPVTAILGTICHPDEVLALAVSNKSESAESLLSVEADGKTVAQFITESGAALGEKVDLRRVGRLEGQKVESYLHRTNKDLPPQVGVP
ncbi:30S ribosomal protein S2, partial [Mycobacterium tuberculosis]|nr:30S ribosomal protein S2 [Mycobacterium tuberculosis]